MFYFGLAKELGMTVAKLLDEITSDEIIYWMAFFKLEKEDYEHEKMTNDVKNKVKR
jgi:hypothetical protein